MMDEVDIRKVVHVLDIKDLLHAGNTLLGGDHLTLLLIDLVVIIDPKPRRDACKFCIPLARFADPPRDDERCSGFIYQDRVNFINDPEGVAPLHHMFGRHRHVVSQIVKTELIVRSVGDVSLVGRSALLRSHPCLDGADFETQESMDVPHPVSVATREIIVDGHDVHTPASEGIEIGRHRACKRFALAGLHLGDHSSVQCAAADHLDVVVPLTENPLRCLADGRVSLSFDVIERLSGSKTFPEPGRSRCEFLIGEFLDLGFKSVHRNGKLLKLPETLALSHTKCFAEDGHVTWILRSYARILENRRSIFSALSQDTRA